MENLQLQNKTVLIADGNNEIGRATALLFAQKGADIAIIYNDKEHSNEIRDKILALNRKCITFSGNINDYIFCEETIKKVVSYLGKIDVLVNNAGIYFPVNNIADLINNGQYFIANKVGTILLCKVILPYLKRGSSIINTTSENAYLGKQDLQNWNFSKGAIISFTIYLAMQARCYGIYVNAVTPKSLILSCSNERFETLSLASIFLDCSKEIALTYLFLAIEASEQNTGKLFCPNQELFFHC